MLTDVTSPTQIMLKYFWPAGWIGVTGYLLLVSLVKPESLRWIGGVTTPWWGRWLLAALVIAGIAAMWKTSVPLKRVRLGEGVAEVEGVRRTVRITAAEVERIHVRGDWGERRSPVVEIHLRARGPFGRRIDFIPVSAEAVERVRKQLGATSPAPAR